MQKLISIFGLAILGAVTCQAGNFPTETPQSDQVVTVSSMEIVSDSPFANLCGCITPSKANEILKACADYWSVPKGELRAEMAHGDLTITPVLYYTGEQAYDVVSEKYGVVCILEIDL